MAIYSISLSSKASLRPVTELELKRSVYESITNLDLLYQNTIGMTSGGLTSGSQWQNTPDQHRIAERSLVWGYFKPLWSYAERGQLDEMLELPGDVTIDIARWISTTQGLSLHERFDHSEAFLKVMSKFFARLKLDYDIDLRLSSPGSLPVFRNGFRPIQIDRFSQIHPQHLTLVELGLLAGVSNLRTIRNAQYDQDSPLKFIKRDKQVLIETREARRWLKRRRGFVPSPSVTEIVEA